VRILSVALSMFVELGFSRTSLQQIADELGITKTALYYHFDSKASLVEAVVQPTIDAANSFLAEMTESHWDSTTLLARYFDLIGAQRMVFRALLKDPTGFTVIDAGEWLANWEEKVQDHFAGPQPTLERRVRALTALSALHRTAVLLSEEDPAELREIAVSVAEEVLLTN